MFIMHNKKRNKKKTYTLKIFWFPFRLVSHWIERILQRNFNNLFFCWHYFLFFSSVLLIRNFISFQRKYYKWRCTTSTSLNKWSTDWTIASKATGPSFITLIAVFGNARSGSGLITGICENRNLRLNIGLNLNFNIGLNNDGAGRRFCRPVWRHDILDTYPFFLARSRSCLFIVCRVPRTSITNV